MSGILRRLANPGLYPAARAALKRVIFCLALFAMTHMGLAQEQKVPIIQILPENVVQDSIKQFQAGTNSFVIFWTYTEAGARKMVELWAANEGKANVKFVVGKFERLGVGGDHRAVPRPLTSYAEWKEGWLQRRTDKIWGLSQEDAKAAVAGLKGK